MTQELNIPFGALAITPEEVYEAMGYGCELPDEEIQETVAEILESMESITMARFMYFTATGVLGKETLQISQTTLNIGSIIAKQLSGSDSFAFFVATAGQEFQQWMDRVKLCDDMVLQYIADSLGSCLAEKVADYMESQLSVALAPQDLKHTNRFSPGYCDWHVSEQQKLFSLFPTPTPCDVQLTDSSLMLPIKSVSGIIGIGSRVRKLEYSCGLCNFERCYKKRKSQQAQY